MVNDNVKKPNWVFWILAIAFILWGLIGCGFYLAEMTMSDAAYAEAFGEELGAVRHVYPTWGLAAYAMAVWSGLAAAILFILRKKISAPLFMFSLGMAVLGFIPSFTNSVLRQAAGDWFWVMPLIVVTLGVVEVLYSRRQRANGILR